jgi:hypothetical protein
MLTAIRQWVIRTMMKSKGQTGVVQTLPKQDIIELNTQITAQRLMQSGIDPQSLKNADQVENAIIAIESRPKVQEGIRSTQSAKVFDLEGKEIKNPKNIMGGKEVKETEAQIKTKLEKGNKKGIARIRARQKMLDDAIDNVSPGFSGDRKVDAELVAEDLAERMGLVYDDLPTKQRLDLYDQAYRGLSKKRFEGMKKSKEYKLNLFKNLDDNKKLNADEIEELEVELGNVNDPDGPDLYEAYPEFDGTAGSAKKILKDNVEYEEYMFDQYTKGNLDPEQPKSNKPITSMDKQINEEFQKGMKEGKFNNVRLKDGRRIESEDDFREYIDELNEDNNFDFAQGGIARLGFKDGMTRRTFLKLLGGMAAVPIVGKFFKLAKVGKTVKQVPVIKTDDVAGKPEWFDALVNKVITEGDDVTKRFATAERQSIHQKTLDDGSVVRVTEDVDDGAVRVEYESDKNVFEETVQMEYKKPLPDEGDPRPAAEFTTAESGPVGRQTGPDDYDIEVDEVGGTSIRDLDSDVSKLKEYATGKKPTMQELVQNIKRREKAAKITEGGDAMIDAVTRRQGDYDPYASGGIARMLGE